MRKELERLVELDRGRNVIVHIGALLGWDQETYMPPRAIGERSEQLAFIEGLAHEKATRSEIGELLGSLGSSAENPSGDGSLEPHVRAYLRVLRRDYDQATRLPASLVEEIARATSLSQATWAEARARNDFAAFAPHLEKVVALMRQKAECLGPDRKAYDVLLDLYEPGSTEASIARVFGALRTELVSILAKIRSRPQVEDSSLHALCPRPRQEAVSEWLMDALAYDRSRGRLDTTAHPFTTTLGVDDVRITTRFMENYLPSSMFSTMHETGHALYELGIDPAPGFAGTRLAEAASMAIHESQSRMWENIVGRSRSFWKANYPKLRSLAGASLDRVDLEGFVKAVNKVEPSFIRTEADEVTYGLHVILRFELEAELMSGALAVRDLPAAWNAKMKDLLGIVPPDDARGCLQDVHWSAGLFGYFPSYSLGNLYAAQFWATMRGAMPGMESEVEQGRLGGLLSWLRENIHRPGSIWLPGELVERVTGSPLDARHFVAYLGEKYARIYGF